MSGSGWTVAVEPVLPVLGAGGQLTVEGGQVILVKPGDSAREARAVKVTVLAYRGEVTDAEGVMLRLDFV